jgi:hypothetical protein
MSRPRAHRPTDTVRLSSAIETSNNRHRSIAPPPSKFKELRIVEKRPSNSLIFRSVAATSASFPNVTRHVSL